MTDMEVDVEVAAVSGDTTSTEQTQLNSSHHLGANSSASSSSTAKHNMDLANNEDDSVVYGELIMLGTNGELPGGGDRGRRKSRYTLRKRIKANGVKPSDQLQVLPSASHSSVFNSKEQHSVSYTLPRRVVVVPYVHDSDTDMFQIGRSTEDQIDFVVMDILPGASLPTYGDELIPSQSTISRFACRIVCERKPPYTARIYAAGFDTSMNIILGEKAPKWINNKNGKKALDGLTTNGVLIMQPKNGFSEASEPTQWKETSVCGEIYQLRESRSAPSPGAKIEDDSNVLVNGTLIDLCGATLLWRSPSKVECMPTPRDIDELIDNLNVGRPQCPVGLTTLAFPRRRLANTQSERQPWVYLECGHVHGRINWGRFGEEERVCPLCRSVGKYVPLWIGSEPAFYLDVAAPTHCFVPCGHVCSSKTVTYWSRTALPHGTQAYNAACPFCATPLEGDPGYKKLIWQQPVE